VLPKDRCERRLKENIGDYKVGVRARKRSMSGAAGRPTCGTSRNMWCARAVVDIPTGIIPILASTPAVLTDSATMRRGISSRTSSVPSVSTSLKTCGSVGAGVTAAGGVSTCGAGEGAGATGVVATGRAAGCATTGVAGVGAGAATLGAGAGVVGGVVGAGVLTGGFVTGGVWACWLAGAGCAVCVPQPTVNAANATTSVRARNFLMGTSRLLVWLYGFCSDGRTNNFGRESLIDSAYVRVREGLEDGSPYVFGLLH